MLKQKMMLEVVKGEKSYQLNLDPGCSLGEVFDVLTEMRQFVVDKIIEAQKSQQPQEEQKAA